MPSKLIYFFLLPFLVVDDAMFFGILVAAIGFFLVKFYTKVEEMGKDIKTLLVNEAANKQKISQLEKEVTEIRDKIME